MVNILDYFQLILDSFNFIFLFPQQSLPPRRLPRRSQSCGSGEVGCGSLRSGRSKDCRRGQGSLRHAPTPRRPPQPRAHRYARTQNGSQHVRNVPSSSEYPLLPIFILLFFLTSLGIITSRPPSGWSETLLGRLRLRGLLEAIRLKGKELPRENKWMTYLEEDEVSSLRHRLITNVKRHLHVCLVSHSRHVSL